MTATITQVVETAQNSAAMRELKDMLQTIEPTLTEIHCELDWSLEIGYEVVARTFEFDDNTLLSRMESELSGDETFKVLNEELQEYVYEIITADNVDNFKNDFSILLPA